MGKSEETRILLTVRGAMLSHSGRVRADNEDVVLYRIPRAGETAAGQGALALVADGMGGHAAGGFASQIAARAISFLYYRKEQDPLAALREGFRAANHLIHQRGQTDVECAGMGTTCTAIVIRDGLLWLAHVGDSRAYLVRDGRISQISEDHSLVATLVRDGSLTPAQAKTSNDRNIILRALGIQPSVEPFFFKEGMKLRERDGIVLCSDGLHDLVDDGRIREIVAGQPPFDACQALVDLALAAGGHDNISVGVFVIEANAPPAKARDRPTREIKLAMALPEPSS